MFGRNLFSAFVLLGLIGCAEPKYVKGTDTTSDGTTAQESKADCSISFSQSGLYLAWFDRPPYLVVEVSTTYNERFQIASCIRFGCKTSGAGGL